MKNIFRFPVDNQHFNDTIEVGKSCIAIQKFLTPEEKSMLFKIAKDGIVRYWGSIPGEANRRNFKKLQQGDEFLCYRSGKYIALAKIAFTITNKNLAIYSWGKTEIGTTWELIYFFSEVEFFQIDSQIVNQAFDFKNGPVMGFGAMSEDKAFKFIKKYGSVKEFLKTMNYEINSMEEALVEIAKSKINSPYEAQYYLVDLGNQLKFETYVPVSDAGREAFGKKLGELVTIRGEDLKQYVAPAIYSPLSNIDVIWFKRDYRPKFFYEVIHKSGWSEALLRLDLVNKHYETAKTRILGPKENEREFQNSIRRWSGPRDNLAYRDYDQLTNLHSETLRFERIVNEFLD